MTKIVIAGIALLAKDTIKSDQDGIRKDLGSLDKRIHDNAVQCLIHAEVHGDTSLMRRLIVETLDAKNSGYRVQGLINWMRLHSPMELKGDVINLSGSIDDIVQSRTLKKAFPERPLDLFEVGKKRPFLVKEANDAPFWTNANNAERVAKPVFQDTMLSPIMRAHKDIMAAIANTVNGQPVDPSKPFFDGVHADKVLNFANKVKELADQLPPDSTREVRVTQARIAKDSEFVKANAPDVKDEGAPLPGEVIPETVARAG